MTRTEAKDITLAIWSSRETEIVQWLIKARGFKSEKAAKRCFDSFRDTMAFVAYQTGNVNI